MKKKVLTTLLIAALVLCTVSAKSSNVKVGVELGLGLDTFKNKVSGQVLSSSASSTTKYRNSGFAANVLAEYAFNSNWSLKADGGIMIAGKATTTVSGSDTKTTCSESSGVYANFALDGKYSVALNKQFSAAAFGGLEAAFGHVYKTGTEDLDKKLNNFAFGVNFGGEVSYAINKNFSVVAGCDFAWFFINSSEAFKSENGKFVIGSTTYASAKVTNTSLALRPYVGATYAF